MKYRLRKVVYILFWYAEKLTCKSIILIKNGGSINFGDRSEKRPQ